MSVSAATITPTKVGPNGTGKITDLATTVAQAAASGGDAFLCQGKECLVINNTDASSHTATIKAVADNFGNVLSGNDITVTVAAGKIAVVGPLSRDKYGDANGLAQITWDAVTGVKIGLFTFSVTA